MQRNIKLTIAYDGTAYHGYQRQQNAITIQQVLEESLAKVFGHALKINGAARTDTGVHAFGQVINFYTTGRIPVARITAAAKSVLPDDIVVVAAEEVPLIFHARFAAKSKIYIYRAYISETPDPFLRYYAWRLQGDYDVAAMRKAAQMIVGEHDFTAFRAAGGKPVNPVRTMLEADCRQSGCMLEFKFWGTGFLYHMVRNLVGTMIDVGCGKINTTDFQAILESKDRNTAGDTAPAQGLYLKEIFY